jgi:hypothetical protein
VADLGNSCHIDDQHRYGIHIELTAAMPTESKILSPRFPFWSLFVFAIIAGSNAPFFV